MNRANETEVGLVIVVLATIAVGLLYLYLGGAIHAGWAKAALFQKMVSCGCPFCFLRPAATL